MSVTRSTAPWTSAGRTAWRSSAFALLASVSLLVLVPGEVPAQSVDGAAATAAPQVGVRVGNHPGYGRVVFDWPTQTSYQAESTGDGLVLRFAQPARVAVGGVGMYPRNVTGLSAEGDAIRIEARPGVRFRHFHHGPKLVVDILDATATQAAAPTSESILADLSAATRLPVPASARAEPAPTVLASAGPAVIASQPAVAPRDVALVPIADVPLATAPAPSPQMVQMAQAGPQGTVRSTMPTAAPLPRSGFPLVQQAQAQPAQIPMPGSVPVPGATLTRPIVLEQGSGRLVELPSPAVTVLVADPRIARVQPASPTSLFVMGVNAGRTNLIATREDGSLVAEFDITVQASATGAAQAAPAVAAAPAVSAGQVQSMIRRMVRGGQNVQVQMVGRGAIGLSGMVPTAADAQRAEAIAKAMGGEGREVINNLTLLSGIQVNLRVRVAEISREVTRDLGFNWLGTFNDGTWRVGMRTGGGVVGSVLNALQNAGTTGGGLIGLGFQSGNFDINGIIDALAQDRLVTILAEPNLTAQSGEVASFLAGGEFPVPIAASNNSSALTVEYKQYGVSLAFIPTVLSPERLNMRVRPEVSELSNANSVTFPIAGGTVTIPGLTVRRAETTIEVGSGQSFAIAGLLTRNSAYNNSGLAGLGEIPILGALFRSDQFRRNETELVIIITPYLVRPVSDPQALATPLDTFRPATDLERILLRRQTGSGAPYRQIRPPAAAGFIVE